MEKGTSVLVTVLVFLISFLWLTAAMPSKLEYLDSLWKSNIGKRQDVSQLGSEILEMKSDIQELKTQQQQFEMVLNNLNATVYSLLNPPQNIRLVEGSSPFEGRVEVFHNGRWGTICDDSWDERDARVVCRQLGYSGGIARSHAYFGRGEEPTWLDDVRCDGSETRIQECRSSPWGNENCNHGEDAGVVCTDPSQPTTAAPPVSLRLAGGYSNSSGRLEVYHDGVWGTVCDDDFDSRDVRVACRQLGFSDNGNQRMNKFGPGSGTIWMDNLECSGSESALSNCPFNGWGNENCGHSEDVGIECEGEDVTTPLPQQAAALRLVGESTNSSGRLEVYHDGVWGTVCDDEFDSLDLRVACQQLGFSDNEHQRIMVKVGPGSGTIWMDNLACSGDESALSDCPFNGWGNENCGHTEDVGIVCDRDDTLPLPPHKAPLRLFGGSTNSSGRLEVYHDGVWGTVCDDDFDSRDLRVACRQLGFSDDGNQRIVQFSPGSGTIWMDNLACSGDESALSYCSFNGWGNENCGHSEDVGIICDGYDITTPQPTGAHCDILEALACLDHVTNIDMSTVTSPAGLNHMCTEAYPQFMSCINSLPQSCMDSSMRQQMELQTQTIDAMCGSIVTAVDTTGSCPVLIFMPCLEIMTNVQTSETDMGQMCSVYPEFTECLHNLPASCDGDTTFNQAVVPTRDMLQSICG
ncbi:scavenger receptor cysteine-rich domain-containing group B protein-like [Argopecten irradians]|uniref:scavenger receptor cysteine-rich domain-containing group B protein-like n=1 Tax=Argopecten irradians TaxID=31199 RepID=UPI003711731D